MVRPIPQESISTCRFAQRVACISNIAFVNEELDPRLIIKRLKKENGDLRAELALLKGGDSNTDPLSEEQREKCVSLCLSVLFWLLSVFLSFGADHVFSLLCRVRTLVKSYVDDGSADAQLVLTDMRMIREAFFTLKVACGSLCGSDWGCSR
jgi:hypothetical protein